MIMRVLIDDEAPPIYIGTEHKDMIGRRVLDLGKDDNKLYIKLGPNMHEMKVAANGKITKESQHCEEIICMAFEATEEDRDDGYFVDVWAPSFLRAAVASEVFSNVEGSAYVLMGFLTREDAIAYRQRRNRREAEDDEKRKRQLFEQLKAEFEPEIPVAKPTIKIKPGRTRRVFGKQEGGK